MLRTRSLAAPAALALALVVLAGCGGGTGEDGLHGFTRPEPLQVGGAALPDVMRAPGAPPMAFRAPSGGMLLVFFGYTHCPDECPTTLADLRQAQRLLDPADRARTSVAFVTVDPARDTRPVLRSYVRRFSSAWHGLRPATKAQQRAAEQPFRVGTRAMPPGTGGGYEVAHSLETYGVDDHGTVVVEWRYGTAAAAIAADVRHLLG